MLFEEEEVGERRLIHGFVLALFGFSLLGFVEVRVFVVRLCEASFSSGESNWFWRENEFFFVHV